MVIKKKLLVVVLIVLVASAGSAVAIYTVVSPSVPSSPGENYMVLKYVSTSMEPTIHEGSYILVDKSVKPSELNVDYPNSDIIVFHKPTNPDELIGHRIANKTIIDGKLHFYTKGDANPINKWPNAIQESEYDSWGAISEDLIVGKVVNTNYK